MALADKNAGLHKVMTAKRNSQLPKGKISSEEPQRRKKNSSQGLELHTENQTAEKVLFIL